MTGDQLLSQVEEKHLEVGIGLFEECDHGFPTFLHAKES
jgi:hypothetical protein